MTVMAEKTAAPAGTVDADPRVVEALAALDRAETERAALEGRVTAGRRVTAAELANARAEVDLAQLRVGAARQAVLDERAAAEQEMREQARADALALLADGAPGDPVALRAAYGRAWEAVEAFLVASDGFDRAVDEAARLLTRAGAPKCGGSAADMAGPPASPESPRWARVGANARVDLGGGDVRVVDGTAARVAYLLARLDEVHGIRATDARQSVAARMRDLLPSSGLHPGLDAVRVGGA